MSSAAVLECILVGGDSEESRHNYGPRLLGRANNATATIICLLELPS